MGDLECLKSAKQEMEMENNSDAKDKKLRILNLAIKEQMCTYNQCQLIISAVKEVLRKGDKITPALSEKVNKIIAIKETSHFFQSSSQETNVLGLPDISNQVPELLYDEAAQLRTAVEEIIEEYCRDVKLEEEKRRILASKHSSTDKSKILKLTVELDQSVIKFNESLNHLCSILEEMCGKSTAEMQNIHESRAECLSEELICTDMNFRRLNQQIFKQIYNEHKDTLGAIEKINLSLQQDMDAATLELERLKTLKGSYDRLLQIDRYQKICKEYHEVQRMIKDKKWILQSFK